MVSTGLGRIDVQVHHSEKQIPYSVLHYDPAVFYLNDSIYLCLFDVCEQTQAYAIIDTHQVPENLREDRILARVSINCASLD
jgi:hypothetical protein